ncbi:MAG: molybdenum cofactor guanylyltransferase [Chloroflexi bacterium]|nr:molybdenum cofactor guanylyltransferase [Chloroflexota bacterium]
MDISCIILAGGKSLRLGRNKTLEVIGGKSLLERVVSGVSFLESDVIIVISPEHVLVPQKNRPKVRTITDIYPGKSSLGGIYTGITASNSFYNLVVACDMPFLNQKLLRYMIGLSPGYDLVVPRVGSLVEPLHAVYSKACLPPIESLLKEGTLKLDRLFSLVKVRYVEAEEIDRFDPEHLSFFNINTEADLQRAIKLAGEGHDKR